MLEHIDQHPDIDELTRPELCFRIRKFGLELYRSGGLVHLVVDHLELATIDHRLVIGTKRLNHQRALGEGLVHIRELLLRKREKDRHRTDLGNDHDAGRVRGVDDVAFVNLADASASIKRRDNRSVIENGAGIVDDRLIDLQLSFKLRNHRDLSIELLACDGVRGREFRIALKINLSVR